LLSSRGNHDALTNGLADKRDSPRELPEFLRGVAEEVHGIWKVSFQVEGRGTVHRVLSAELRADEEEIHVAVPASPASGPRSEEDHPADLISLCDLPTEGPEPPDQTI